MEYIFVDVRIQDVGVPPMLVLPSDVMGRDVWPRALGLALKWPWVGPGISGRGRKHRRNDNIVPFLSCAH